MTLTKVKNYIKINAVGIVLSDNGYAGLKRNKGNSRPSWFIPCSMQQDSPLVLLSHRATRPFGNW